MNKQDEVALKKDLSKASNVLIACNDARFNYVFSQEQSIKDFEQTEEVITLDQYDYSVKRDQGTDTKLPGIVPVSMIQASSSLETMEEWYRQKHPELPDEYWGIMARYSTGQQLTKKDTKNELKKMKKKKNKKAPVGMSVAYGQYEISFD